MTFIDYNVNFTTWTVWTSGLLVKDALTLEFNDDDGKIIFVEVMLVYSARGYGRMGKQNHYHLDDRMLCKHQQYMKRVNSYRKHYVIPVLEALKGIKYKSVNAFIKEYNWMIKNITPLEAFRLMGVKYV